MLSLLLSFQIQLITPILLISSHFVRSNLKLCFVWDIPFKLQKPFQTQHSQICVLLKTVPLSFHKHILYTSCSTFGWASPCFLPVSANNLYHQLKFNTIKSMFFPNSNTFLQTSYRLLISCVLFVSLWSVLFYCVLLFSSVFCSSLLWPVILYCVLFFSTVSCSSLLCPILFYCVLFFSTVSCSALLCPVLLYCVLFLFTVSCSYLLCPILFYCVLFFSTVSYSSLLCSALLICIVCSSTVSYSSLLCSILLYCVLLFFTVFYSSLRVLFSSTVFYSSLRVLFSSLLFTILL